MSFTAGVLGLGRREVLLTRIRAIRAEVQAIFDKVLDEGPQTASPASPTTTTEPRHALEQSPSSAAALPAAAAAASRGAGSQSLRTVSTSSRAPRDGEAAPHVSVRECARVYENKLKSCREIILDTRARRCAQLRKFHEFEKAHKEEMKKLNAILTEETETEQYLLTAVQISQKVEEREDRKRTRDAGADGARSRDAEERPPRRRRDDAYDAARGSAGPASVN